MANASPKPCPLEKYTLLKLERFTKISSSGDVKKELEERAKSSKATLAHLQSLKEKAFQINEKLRGEIKPLETSLKKSRNRLDLAYKTTNETNDRKLFSIQNRLETVMHEIKTIANNIPSSVQTFEVASTKPTDHELHVDCSQTETNKPIEQDAIRTMLTKTISPSSCVLVCAPRDKTYNLPKPTRRRRRFEASFACPTEVKTSDSRKTDKQSASFQEEGDMIIIGDSGRTKVLKSLFENLKSQKYTVMTRYLMNNLFSRELLAAYSASGRASPTFANDKKRRNSLDDTTVNDIIRCVSQTSNVHPRYVRSAFISKCEDEYKMYKLREKMMEKRRLDAHMRVEAEAERKFNVDE